MFTKEDLEAQAKEIEGAMQQMVANYNVLQGKLAAVNEWMSKFAPGVVKIEEGVGDIVDGVADVVEGTISVANEIGIE